MAATTEYISIEEAWKTIFETGRITTGLFENWYQYAESYLIGRQFSMRNLDDENGRRQLHITKRLLTDPFSPWSRYNQFELSVEATEATTH